MGRFLRSGKKALFLSSLSRNTGKEVRDENWVDIAGVRSRSLPDLPGSLYLRLAATILDRAEETSNLAVVLLEKKIIEVFKRFEGAISL